MRRQQSLPTLPPAGRTWAPAVAPGSRRTVRDRLRRSLRVRQQACRPAGALRPSNPSVLY
jgi:hypothetical protein